MTATEKARIDALALEILDNVQDTNGDGYDFMAAVNVRIRGMCPDGCCGGIGEAETVTDAEIATDAYARKLIARGFEVLG